MARLPRVDNNLQDMLRQGEVPVWSGRPDPSVRFAPGDALMVPLSVLWLAFGGLLEGIVVAEHGPTIMAVGGATFVALGVYLVFGRFVHKRRRKLRTLYAVTSERALIIIGSGLYDSVSLDQPVLVQRSRDGNHITIQIGKAGYWRGRPSILRNTGLDFIDVLHREPVTFYDVLDAQALWTALGTAGKT